MGLLKEVFDGLQAQLAATARSSIATCRKLLKNGTLKTCKDFPHGIPTTHADIINGGLLAF